MAKETKKSAKGASKSASKASKAVKPAKKAAPAKAPVKASAKAPAKSAKAATSKVASSKAAPAKVASKAAAASAKPSKAAPKAEKPGIKASTKSTAKVAEKPIAQKPIAEKKSSSKTASGIAAGVAAVGVAAIGIAASKASKSSTEKGKESPQKLSTMPKKEETNGQAKSTESAPTVTQAAHGNVPAMKLSVNDAEILATATERYGNKELEYFRKLILEQRAEASEEFDIISEQMLDTSGEFDADNQAYSLHTAEQGTDAMEREKTFLHAQRTSDYIKKLDEALARIDRGTYGICVICGKLIQKERLGAVPITQKHVDCKNKTQAKKLSVDQVYREFPEEPAVD